MDYSLSLFKRKLLPNIRQCVRNSKEDYGRHLFVHCAGNDIKEESGIYRENDKVITFSIGNGRIHVLQWRNTSCLDMDDYFPEVIIDRYYSISDDIFCGFNQKERQFCVFGVGPRKEMSSEAEEYDIFTEDPFDNDREIKGDQNSRKWKKDRISDGITLLHTEKLSFEPIYEYLDLGGREFSSRCFYCVSPENAIFQLEVSIAGNVSCRVHILLNKCPSLSFDGVTKVTFIPRGDRGSSEGIVVISTGFLLWSIVIGKRTHVKKRLHSEKILALFPVENRVVGNGVLAVGDNLAVSFFKISNSGNDLLLSSEHVNQHQISVEKIVRCIKFRDLNVGNENEIISFLALTRRSTLHYCQVEISQGNLKVLSHVVTMPFHILASSEFVVERSMIAIAIVTKNMSLGLLKLEPMRCKNNDEVGLDPIDGSVEAFMSLEREKVQLERNISLLSHDVFELATAVRIFEALKSDEIQATATLIASDRSLGENYSLECNVRNATGCGFSDGWRLQITPISSFKKEVDTFSTELNSSLEDSRKYFAAMPLQNGIAPFSVVLSFVFTHVVRFPDRIISATNAIPPVPISFIGSQKYSANVEVERCSVCTDWPLEYIFRLRGGYIPRIGSFSGLSLVTTSSSPGSNEVSIVASGPEFVYIIPHIVFSIRSEDKKLRDDFKLSDYVQTELLGDCLLELKKVTSTFARQYIYEAGAERNVNVNLESGLNQYLEVHNLSSLGEHIATEKYFLALWNIYWSLRGKIPTLEYLLVER